MYIQCEPPDYELVFGMDPMGRWGTLRGAIKRLFFLCRGDDRSKHEFFWGTIWVESSNGRVYSFNELCSLAVSSGWIKDSESGERWVGG